MSLSSALRKALAPSLLALMTAFTPAANAADAAPVKYDPARGVIDGDKYTREEASKFVCLGKNPNTGSFDPACSDTNGQLVVYSMKKGSNLVMLTSNLDQTRGLIIERDGKDYAVQSVVADPRFNSDLSSSSFSSPQKELYCVLNGSDTTLSVSQPMGDNVVTHRHVD